MPTAFSSARGPRAALMVLGLHGLLLLGALQLGVWRDRAPPPPDRPALIVRLLWPQSPVVPAPDSAARPRRPDLRAQAAATRPAAPPAPAAPTAPPATTPATQPQAITLPPANTPADAPAPPATPAPLDLRLPRGASAPWRARNPALDDDPAGTNPVARQTIEAHIAAALGGSDQITEERLQDGRLRLRRGSQCVIAYPNRAERIDPFNSSVLPKPRGVQKC